MIQVFLFYCNVGPSALHKSNNFVHHLLPWHPADLDLKQEEAVGVLAFNGCCKMGTK